MLSEVRLALREPPDLGVPDRQRHPADDPVHLRGDRALPGAHLLRRRARDPGAKLRNPRRLERIKGRRSYMYTGCKIHIWTLYEVCMALFDTTKVRCIRHLYKLFPGLQVHSCPWGCGGGLRLASVLEEAPEGVRALAIPREEPREAT